MKGTIQSSDFVASCSSFSSVRTFSPPRYRRKKRALLTTLTLLVSALVLLPPTTSAAQHSISLPEELFPSESFTETLLLKPLPDGRVLSSFDFTLTSTSSSTSNFHLLPRTLLQPIQHFGVSEVHLSLNSGRWRYNSWGSPVTTLKRRSGYGSAKARQDLVVYGENTVADSGKVKVGEESVGSGAELLARFEGQGDQAQRWKGLTSALAGLFCASLDALDERQTVQPYYAYSSSSALSNATQTLHALLPTEGVCTENLTPFLKLLPCKNSAGLATLLNPLSLFRANFQGLAVHVKRLPEPPSQTVQGRGENVGGWEVKLTFTAVFAPAVTRDVSVRDWSISSLFGRALQSPCPLADESLVRILKPNDPEGSAKYQVEPLPPSPSCSMGGGIPSGRGCAEMFPALEEQDEVTDELAAAGLLAFESDQEEKGYQDRLEERWAHYLDSVDGEYLYDVPTMLAVEAGLESRLGGTLPRFEKGGSRSLDVKMSWPHETRFVYPNTENRTTQTVEVERTLVGSGQERTMLQVVLTNTDKRVAQRVLWYETLGYFVKPYLHTLSHEVSFLSSTSTSDSMGGEDELLRSIEDFNNPVEELTYQPTSGTRGSRKPLVLEGVVRIPARSKVTLRIEMRKEFVPYSQHPPDAHRGFDLNPAIIFPLSPVDPRESLRSPPTSRHSNIAAQTLPSQSMISTLINHLHQAVSRGGNYDVDAGREALRTRAKTMSKSQPRIYTLPRLVELATPDFSFVYTNIIFTSTVIALFFGSTLNTLLRTFTDLVI